jgi:hypothetical protein
MTPIEAKFLAMMTVGFTHFVDIGKGTDAAIFYESENKVHMQIPGVPNVMHGEWKLLPDGYFVKWKNGPEGKWQISSSLGTFTYIDPAGKPAGTITRIMPGDAGHLK